MRNLHIRKQLVPHNTINKGIQEKVMPKEGILGNTWHGVECKNR